MGNESRPRIGRTGTIVVWTVAILWFMVGAGTAWACQITQITPNSGLPGQILDVTLEGRGFGFVQVKSVEFGDLPVEILELPPTTPEPVPDSLRVQVNISPDTPPGPRDVVVTGVEFSCSMPGGFTVQEKAAKADLSVTKTASPSPVGSGQMITYTITVTNNGPDPATDVSLIEILPGIDQLSLELPFVTSQGTCSLPSGSFEQRVNCNLGNLPVGATATLTIRGVVLAKAGDTLSNSAVVNGNEEDPNFENSNAQTETSVTEAPQENQPPVAEFTFSPSEPVVGEEITFDASASFDPDGEIVQYLWDFGDGDGGEGVTVSHIYETPGSFPVALTVFDDDSLSTVLTHDLFVTEAPQGNQPEVTIDRVIWNGFPSNVGEVEAALPPTLDCPASADIMREFEDVCGFLNVWADFNGDGVIASYTTPDGGEQPEWLAGNIPMMKDESQTVRLGVSFPIVDPRIDVGESFDVGGILTGSPVETPPTAAVPMRRKVVGTTQRLVVSPGKEAPIPSTLTPDEVRFDVSIFGVPLGEFLLRLNVPDIAQKPNECTPTSTANSLRWLAKKHGFNDKLPSSDSDLVKDLVKAMKTSSTTGTSDEDMVNGKKSYIKDKKLPLTVEAQDDEGASGATKTKPTAEFLIEQLKKGQDVEIGFTFTGGGGHWVTAVGVVRMGGKLGVYINDPDDNKSGARFYELVKRSDGFLELKGYGKHNYIDIIVAESPKPPPRETTVWSAEGKVRHPDGTVVEGKMRGIDTDGDGKADKVESEYRVDKDGDGKPEKVVKRTEQVKSADSETIVEDLDKDGKLKKRTTIRINDKNDDGLDRNDTKEVIREEDKNGDGDFNDPGERQTEMKKFPDTFIRENEEILISEADNLSSLGETSSRVGQPITGAASLFSLGETSSRDELTAGGIAKQLAGTIYMVVPSKLEAATRSLQSAKADFQSGGHDPAAQNVQRLLDQLAGGNTIEQALDANGNGLLDDDEIQTAIQLWIRGEPVPGTDGQIIDDAKITELIRKWIRGEPLSGASSAQNQSLEGPEPLSVQGAHLRPTVDGFALEVQGQGIRRTRLEVFDLAGRRLLTEEAEGNRLRFAAVDEAGRRWANGVYLYLVTAYGERGQVRRSAVRKLMVLR